MTAIVQLIEILRFALDDKALKWKGGPEAAFYCIIRHRTSVLGLA
jgi:hypothetical protein